VVNPSVQEQRQDVASTPVTPGKPELTIPAKGQDFGSLSSEPSEQYQPACDWPVELGASRGARPDRRRLAGLILTTWLTAFVSQQTTARVIPAFYPMAHWAVVSAAQIRCRQDITNWGDADMPFGKFISQGRHVSKRVRLVNSTGVIPSVGLWARSRCDQVRSTRLAWGAFDW